MKRFLALSLIIIFAFAGISVAFAAEPAELKIGDADLNSVVNVRDATLIQKHVASMVELSGDALKVADTDASGKVNVKDATLIQKFVAGLTDGFPAQPVPTEPESTTEEPTEDTTFVPTEEPTEIPTEPPTTSAPETDPTEPEPTKPTEAPTKPSVDDDGYFDVVVRP